MQFNVYPHEDNSGDWVVEAIDIDGEGEILTAIFSGKNAKTRAESYANWQQRTFTQSDQQVAA
jgi:hypothetical protein